MNRFWRCCRRCCRWFCRSRCRPLGSVVHLWQRVHNSLFSLSVRWLLLPCRLPSIQSRRCICLCESVYRITSQIIRIKYCPRVVISYVMVVLEITNHSSSVLRAVRFFFWDFRLSDNLIIGLSPLTCGRYVLHIMTAMHIVTMIITASEIGSKIIPKCFS